MIEKYSIAENKWQAVNFKLYQGLEAGHICSLEANKILLIGGKVLGGECTYVHEIDLLKQTIINKKYSPLTQS